MRKRRYNHTELLKRIDAIELAVIQDDILHMGPKQVEWLQLRLSCRTYGFRRAFWARKPLPDYAPEVSKVCDVGVA